MKRELKEIRKRSQYIRVHTPDVLIECYEMQNHICDLCGHEIQCVASEIAELDHSVPVYYFAAGPLEIEKAERLCNDRNNLRATHGLCNTKKNTLPREEWFAKEMDKLVGPAPILTENEISFLKNRSAEAARQAGIASNKNPKNRNRLQRFTTFETCSKGGKKGGQRGVETGQIVALGKSRGKENKESGHWDRIRVLGNVFDAEYGREQGLKNVKSGHLKKLDQGHKNANKPGYMSFIGKIGGAKGGRMSNHLRWHIKRDIINLNCSLCRELGESDGRERKTQQKRS